MKTLFVFALVMSVWSCSGLPVYDYEPSIAEEALHASIGRVNSRSQWPALFGVVRSYVRGVDLLDNNDYSIVLDFIVRETTCTKDSEKDPSLCDFRVGRYVQTAFCRSTVRVSEEQIQNLAVYCSQDGSSSESSSSEERMFMEMMAPNRRGDSRNEAQLAPEAFSAGRRRQSYKAQRRSTVQCEPQSVVPGAETRCCSYRLYWWECQRDKQEWKQHYRCVTQ